MAKFERQFVPRNEIRGVLVLDECERATEEALAAFAQNSNGRLKFICVGPAEKLYVTSPPTATPFYQIKPMLNDDVRSILMSSYPTAAPEIIDAAEIEPGSPEAHCSSAEEALGGG